MYFEQGPAALSRRIDAAPVNAPKKMVPLSIATGAARCIVGVPTLPSSASTALEPRAIAVVDTGVCPGAGFVVDGHFGASLVETCASTSVRAACSARSG